MTTFEYLAVAYSLLFSITALRLVGALPYVFRRERVYGVHAAVVVLLILTINKRDSDSRSNSYSVNAG